MGFTTPVDSVKLRINYTVPVETGDLAKLKVRVKGLVNLAEFPSFLRLTVHGRDGDNFVTLGSSQLTWTAGLDQGSFTKDIEHDIDLSKLDEDKKSKSFPRDEIVVRVVKVSPIGDSSAVESNVVKAHFGVGETPAN